MRLEVHDGDGLGFRSGTEVLDEIFDLITERLPDLHPNDPVRAALSRLAPFLGEALGRPRVQLVPSVVAS